MIGNRYAVEVDGVMEENRLYVARDTFTDEKVLLKIFYHNKYINKDFIQNLIDVSTAINDINSKYILKIKDIGMRYEKVLLKIFYHNKYINKDFIQNLIDVSTAINDINSKYILKIKDIGMRYNEDKHFYFISYEYIEGVELSELIKGNYLHTLYLMNILKE